MMQDVKKTPSSDDMQWMPWHERCLSVTDHLLRVWREDREDPKIEESLQHIPESKRIVAG